MYSSLRNVQILVALLKEYNIDTVVISPGNSHNAIVRSLENDSYFKTYNIVDERSAAFFAVGLMEELKRPVAVCCTSGTAVSNYLSGVTEASRRNLPLVVITGDKNPYYLGQYEDQVIDEISMFKGVVKYSCQLPIVRDDKDEWYCGRVINEALLELNHHGKGPVQIDVPIEKGMLAIGKDFNTETLPKVRVINRLDMLSDNEKWQEKFAELKNKKVMLICGQDDHITTDEMQMIQKLAEKNKFVFAADIISNLHGQGVFNITGIAKKFSNSIEPIMPEVVISFAGNTALDFKFRLKNYPNIHWIVNEDGRVADPYKNLELVIEATTEDFLRKLCEFAPKANGDYYDFIESACNNLKIPEIEYSNLYAVSKVMKEIPAGSNLHIANSTAIRIAQYFELDETVQVYCNRGVNGIDGCMSSFVGHAAATDKLSYLVIGDLSFFYDMNALWNRYIGNNIRILLSNNGGAALFHFNQGLTNYPTLNENVAAEHFATAKGWAESQGLCYLSARDKSEFDNNFEKFMTKESDKPIIFEVFTQKEKDAQIQRDFYDKITDKNAEEQFKSGAKKMIKSLLGDDIIRKLKGN